MNQLDMFSPLSALVKSDHWNRAVNLTVARQKRDAGIKKVAGKNKAFLDLMRPVARDICRIQGWVSSNELRAWADMNGVAPNHYNAWGAVLTTKEFVPGEYIVSEQPQGHCNRVRRWTLRATA